MAMAKHEKLGKFLQKAATSGKKEDRLNIKIIRADDLHDIEFVKTGNPLWDATIGGFPRGMYTIMFGGEGVGKTTFILATSGHITENKGSVVIMEPENRADKHWWARYLDLKKVYVSQATGLGPCLDSLWKIASSGHVDLIVVDSLAALAVKELKGKGSEGDHMALVARRLPQFFQIATEIIAGTQTAIVFIHQKRDVLDPYSGAIETYNGGNALKHHCSLVLNMRRASTSKDPGEGERFIDSSKTKIGFMANIRCTKGTVGTITEGRSIQLDYSFANGPLKSQSIAMYALRNKIIAKDGPGRYKFGGSYTQHGLNNVLIDIENGEGLRNSVLNACKEHILGTQKMVTISPDAEFEGSQTGAVPADISGTKTIEKGASDDAVKEQEAVQKKDDTKKK